MNQWEFKQRVVNLYEAKNLKLDLDNTPASRIQLCYKNARKIWSCIFEIFKTPKKNEEKIVPKQQ